MSLITVKGHAVQSGRIVFGLSGTWEAELVVDADAASDVQGSVKLKVGDDDELTGTAYPGEDTGKQVTVRVVGGAGGLLTAVGPQGYGTSATRRTVLNDALNAGSETLSNDSDQGVLNATSRWTRLAGTVGDALRAVCLHAGCNWRVLDDGKVWFGTDDWKKIDPEPEHTVERDEPTRQRMTIAIESLAVRPGKTFRDQRICEAIYRIEPTRLRGDFRYGADRDGISAMLSVLVRRELGPAVDASAAYAFTIQSQESDGSLNVKSTDSRLPNLDRVPVRVGILGVSENKWNANGIAYLTHENGDLAKPVIVAVDQRQAKTLVVDTTDKVELKSGSASAKVEPSAIELTAGQTLKVSSSAVECGGSQPLILLSALTAWIAQLTSAGSGVGLVVPPWTDPGTTITKGS